MSNAENDRDVTTKYERLVGQITASIRNKDVKEDVQSRAYQRILEIIDDLGEDGVNLTYIRTSLKWIKSNFINRSVRGFDARQRRYQRQGTFIDIDSSWKEITNNAVIDAALKGLKPIERVSLRMHFWYGYSFVDIGNITTCEYAEVINAKNNAIKKLKRNNFVCEFREI